MSLPGLAQDADADGAPDLSDAAPCDPERAGFAYFPGEGAHGVLAFEDLWPGWSDYDFNDVVVGYNFAYHLDAAGQVVQVVAQLQPRALGAVAHSGLALHLPVPTASVAAVSLQVGAASERLMPLSDRELTVVLSEDLRSGFGETNGFVNTESGGSSSSSPPMVVTVDFFAPVPAFQVQAPHDVFIFRSDDTSLEIHRTPFRGSSRADRSRFGTERDRSVEGHWYVNASDFPYVLDLPADAAYPEEHENIATAFPRFASWVSSGGSTDADFYRSPDPAAVYTDSAGRHGPPLAAPPSVAVDYACLARPVAVSTDLVIDDSNVGQYAGAALTVPAGVTLTLDLQRPLQLFSLELAGTLRSSGCSTSACGGVELEVLSDVRIRPSGHIDVDGAGYLGSRQSGNGAQGRTRGNVAASASYQSGASHGGYGGRTNGQSNPVYGDLFDPRYPGAGATGHNTTSSNYRGGNGGGVVRITAGGTMVLDGLVSANGARGSRYDAGGAGGAILLQAQRFESWSPSTPRVQANGATGYYSGGGGGRIALYGDLSGLGPIESIAIAAGGVSATNGSRHGGSGTVVHGAGREAASVLVSAVSGRNASFAGTPVGTFGPVTGLSARTLSTDIELEPGALEGGWLYPDVESDVRFAIVSNAEHQITVAEGDLNGVSAVGRTFAVALELERLDVLGDVRVGFGRLNVSDSARIAGTSQLVGDWLGGHTVAFEDSSQIQARRIVAETFRAGDAARLVLRTLEVGAGRLTDGVQVEAWPSTVQGVFPLELLASELELGVGVSVSVDARGYLGSRNEGNGSKGRTQGNQSASSASYQSGGSHGGYGGRTNGSPTPVYGDLREPTEAGAGGSGHNTSSVNYRGGHGGGVLRVAVSGRFTLDGRLSANGGTGGSYDTGGAGGSVWVSAGTLAGSGTYRDATISADGASGYYSGGGGGRVAVHYGALEGFRIDPLTVTAHGGTSRTNGSRHGGSGTVFSQAASQPNGRLQIHSPAGRLASFGPTPITASGGSDSFDELYLSGSTWARAGTLDVSGAVTVRDDVSLEFGELAVGTLTLRDAAQLSGRSVAGGELTLQDSALATLDTVDVDTGRLEDGARLTTHAPTTSDVHPLTVRARYFSLEPGTEVSVAALGYLGSRQSGNGAQGRTLGNEAGAGSYQSAGSHGGFGGVTSGAPVPSYGDPIHPRTAGSGGTGTNTSDARYRAGTGGGVLRLDVQEQLVLDGLLDARGGRGGSYDTGGAGGSIWITAGEVHTSQSGLRIVASGAPGYYTGAGGGRVAIHAGRLSGFSVDDTSVQVHGGSSSTNGARHGGSGTIVYQVGADPLPSLLLTAPAGRVASGRPTRIGSFGRVASLAGDTLGVDSWLEPGSLVGQVLVPDDQVESSTVAIVDNDADSIRALGWLDDLSAVGRGFFVRDASTRWLDVTVRGDVQVEAGYLDVLDELRVENGARLTAVSVDARSFELEDTVVVGLGRLGFDVAELEDDASLTTKLLDGRSLALRGSAVIYAPETSLAGPTALRVFVAELDLESGARFDAMGRGYLGSRQAGNGARGRTEGNVSSTASFQSGGSHGGLGGVTTGTPAPTYGDSRAPVSFGSGGTGHNTTSSAYRGGTGGGAIRVVVDGTFSLEGTVDVRGARGSSYDASGAGGSVWIDAGTLTGSGRVLADGVSSYYGAGGGGRVAIFTAAPDRSAVVATASGGHGRNAAYNGHDGSVVRD